MSNVKGTPKSRPHQVFFLEKARRCQSEIVSRYLFVAMRKSWVIKCLTRPSLLFRLLKEPIYINFSWRSTTSFMSRESKKNRQRRVVFCAFGNKMPGKLNPEKPPGSRNVPFVKNTDRNCLIPASMELQFMLFVR